MPWAHTLGMRSSRRLDKRTSIGNSAARTRVGSSATGKTASSGQSTSEHDGVSNWQRHRLESTTWHYPVYERPSASKPHLQFQFGPLCMRGPSRLNKAPHCAATGKFIHTSACKLPDHDERPFAGEEKTESLRTAQPGRDQRYCF